MFFGLAVAALRVALAIELDANPTAVVIAAGIEFSVRAIEAPPAAVQAIPSTADNAKIL